MQKEKDTSRKTEESGESGSDQSQHDIESQYLGDGTSVSLFNGVVYLEHDYIVNRIRLDMAVLSEFVAWLNDVGLLDKIDYDSRSLKTS